jgi:hypothetical protein
MDTGLPEALEQMKVAIRRVYLEVAAADTGSGVAAHYVALEMLDQAYKLVIADLEARHGGEPEQQIN